MAIGELAEATTTVDYVRYELEDGGEWVDITRLTDGSIMCCHCFHYLPREELEEIEPGVYTDVCRPCYKADKEALEWKLNHDEEFADWYRDAYGVNAYLEGLAGYSDPDR